MTPIFLTSGEYGIIVSLQMMAEGVDGGVFLYSRFKKRSSVFEFEMQRITSAQYAQDRYIRRDKLLFEWKNVTGCITPANWAIVPKSRNSWIEGLPLIFAMITIPPLYR